MTEPRRWWGIEHTCDGQDRRYPTLHWANEPDVGAGPREAFECDACGERYTFREAEAAQGAAPRAEGLDEDHAPVFDPDIPCSCGASHRASFYRAAPRAEDPRTHEQQMIDGDRLRIDERHSVIDRLVGRHEWVINGDSFYHFRGGGTAEFRYTCRCGAMSQRTWRGDYEEGRPMTDEEEAAVGRYLL